MYKAYKNYCLTSHFQDLSIHRSINYSELEKHVKSKKDIIAVSLGSSSEVITRYSTITTLKYLVKEIVTHNNLSSSFFSLEFSFDIYIFKYTFEYVYTPEILNIENFSNFEYEKHYEACLDIYESTFTQKEIATKHKLNLKSFRDFILKTLPIYNLALSQKLLNVSHFNLNKMDIKLHVRYLFLNWHYTVKELSVAFDLPYATCWEICNRPPKKLQDYITEFGEPDFSSTYLK